MLFCSKGSKPIIKQPRKIKIQKLVLLFALVSPLVACVSSQDHRPHKKRCNYVDDGFLLKDCGYAPTKEAFTEFLKTQASEVARLAQEFPCGFTSCPKFKRDLEFHYQSSSTPTSKAHEERLLSSSPVITTKISDGYHSSFSSEKTIVDKKQEDDKSASPVKKTEELNVEYDTQSSPNGPMNNDNPTRISYTTLTGESEGYKETHFVASEFVDAMFDEYGGLRAIPYLDSSPPPTSSAAYEALEVSIIKPVNNEEGLAIDSLIDTRDQISEEKAKKEAKFLD
ncbi:hypothetical protein CROQUDRAFT_130189 [Cronartium quercuum f. sp. fusiforme G11]|uniref:Lipoprotein n=1 Tax=Cronartium quercuum f. sp. fusiforme G11 TaxID=708437 RepID=A0A9P6TG02_9BASI|nr:hypothetical protein CROQUDRAFT_130189 [Cronartium quercuum f. sp. fusiforme G11]